MIVKVNFKQTNERPLGFWEKIKAKILTAKLKRRWKKDPQFRAHVEAAVKKGLKNMSKPIMSAGPK